MTNRTIIIVWSWASKGLGEGTWSVSGKSHDKDQLICRDILAGPEGIASIQLLIHEHQREGQVMVFLHRQHGYHSEHIVQLLQQKQTSDSLYCFLFGEGTGPIYLTNQARGLLGTSGTFSARVNFDNQPIALTSIDDKQARTLKSNHFDFVWQYYSMALYERTATLKEDLFSVLSQHTNTTFAPGELYQWLNQPTNRQLLLRLLSFAGRIRKNSDLSKEILTFERAESRTLTFDNYQAQLANATHTNALEAYHKLKNYILRQILNKRDTVSLLTVRDMFDDLLQILNKPH